MQWSLSRFVYYFIGLSVLAILGYGIHAVFTTEPEVETITVSRGTVESVVSVSGFVEATQLANLGFPTNGIVTDVMVQEGDVIEAGDIIATQGAQQLVAQRIQAVAARDALAAQLEASENGASPETIALSVIAADNAETALEKTKQEQATKIEAARRTLYSNNLQARSTDSAEEAVPPTISGAYTCTATGTYSISLYSSQADSNYSYRYNGLETGNDTAYINQPDTLGECGLSIQFAPNSKYNASNWTIQIPNTDAPNYTSVQNAYNIAVEQADVAITAAENALLSNTQEEVAVTARTRREILAQQSAELRSAQAKITEIDAAIIDRSIIAPFSGVVTDVSVEIGETAGTAPVITTLANNTFELITRIPEIDINQIAVGQTAFVTFDAAADERLAGTIIYVAPLAIEIDGVAYFEAKIQLEQTPTWLRAGLNSDIDIVTNTQPDLLRLPKRYITTTDTSDTVLVMRDGAYTPTTVTIVAAGTDGFVGITGVAEGDTIALPGV